MHAGQCGPPPRGYQLPTPCLAHTMLGPQQVNRCMHSHHVRLITLKGQLEPPEYGLPAVQCQEGIIKCGQCMLPTLPPCMEGSVKVLSRCRALTSSASRTSTTPGTRVNNGGVLEGEGVRDRHRLAGRQARAQEEGGRQTGGQAGRRPTLSHLHQQLLLLSGRGAQQQVGPALAVCRRDLVGWAEEAGGKARAALAKRTQHARQGGCSLRAQGFTRSRVHSLVEGTLIVVRAKALPSTPEIRATLLAQPPQHHALPGTHAPTHLI